MDRDTLTSSSVAESSFATRHFRLILVAACLIAIVAVNRFFDLQRHFSLDHIHQAIQSAGLWGYLFYMVIFVFGELLHVFGLLFVAAGVIAFGKTQGLIMALLGGTLAVSVSFLFMRLIGGRAFAAIEKPWVKKILNRLDRHPIRTVILLRIFLILYPSLNYALALTTIRFRDYLIGSAIGLIPPITLFVLLFDRFMSFFS